ncbi:hypothetical protein KFL_000380310 [Klebsormidium nitens]|uniref:BSD domain-containing protein n=1 Tax=Klebsormidium nitens TaxID=105231 RepID=A0A1Y1HVD5_KLENI|nr:hypothetical protein KFL_000380310 [Klebsormidium nitens]|eukprot:GAQ79798.1 hypothetical protein KFL_000380310 [Klebsormidium nitens]
MNFFSSLLGEDVVPEAKEPAKGQDASKEAEENSNEAPPTNPSESSGLLTFFGSLAKKSEEVLSTYQKDLAEFGKELKKETISVVDTSAKAIPEVPHMLETGAHQAQNNLEKVGHVIEDFGSSFWRGTTEIFGQVKDAIKQADHEISATAKREKGSSSFSTIPRGKYSRFEAQVNAMQRDSSTYCDEPEDADDYAKWREEFKLDSKKEEIEKIGKENAFMQELQSRIVPLIVEYDTFWTRYFYRLHKLKQAEEARAGLVKRASAPEEEELSWDVDEPNTPAGARQPRSPPALPPVPETETPQPGTADEEPPAAADVSVTSPDEAAAPEAAEVAAAEGEEKETVTEGAAADESKKDSPVVPASPRGPSDEEGTTSDGSPEGSTGSGWLVVGKGTDAVTTVKVSPTPQVAEKETAKELEQLEVDDLDVEEPEGAPEVARAPASREKGKGTEEEGEDWGAWE